MTDEKNYKMMFFQPRTKTEAGDRGSKEKLKNEFAHPDNLG